MPSVVLIQVPGLGFPLAPFLQHPLSKFGFTDPLHEGYAVTNEENRGLLIPDHVTASSAV